jgi:hypothetical protein
MDDENDTLNTNNRTDNTERKLLQFSMLDDNICNDVHVMITNTPFCRDIKKPELPELA